MRRCLQRYWCSHASCCVWCFNVLLVSNCINATQVAELCLPCVETKGGILRSIGKKERGQECLKEYILICLHCNSRLYYFNQSIIYNPTNSAKCLVAFTTIFSETTSNYCCFHCLNYLLFLQACYCLALVSLAMSFAWSTRKAFFHVVSQLLSHKLDMFWISTTMLLCKIGNKQRPELKKTKTFTKKKNKK